MRVCLSEEDRESIILARQNWHDAQAMASAESLEEAEDALMAEIIRVGAAPQVLIIDEQALCDLLEL